MSTFTPCIAEINSGIVGNCCIKIGAIPACDQ